VQGVAERLLTQERRASAETHDELRPPAWRAIVIGAVLVPAGVFFGAYAYLIVQALLWGQTSIEQGSVFTLLLLTGASALLGRVWRRLRLQQHELLVVYVMSNLAVCLSGVGFVAFLVHTMAAGHYFATPENGWRELLGDLPAWFGPQNERIVKDFYEATGSLYRWDTVREWALPLTYWGAVILLVVGASVCLTSLLGKQWVERERLTFPLVQLPLEMADTKPGAWFWRSRGMWLGFAAAGLLESVDFVNYLCPAVPTVWLKARSLNALLTEPPWNGLRPFSVAFFPFMIGIGFLLTLETSLSCWFFYLLGKLENVVCIALGFRGAGRGSALSRLPLLHEQGSGAMLALMVAALWIARRPIWEALHGRGGEDETAIVSPRAAMAGLLLSLALLTVLLAVGGLAPPIAAAFFVLYMLFVLAVARIVAETGAGWTMIRANNPHGLLLHALGVPRFSRRSLASFAFLNWLDADYRDAPIVHLLAALKMRREAGIAKAQLGWAIGVASVLALVSAYWAHLHIDYTYGAATAKVRGWYTSVGQQGYRQLASWTSYPLPTDWVSLGGSALGGLAALAIGFARQRVMAWPFHPVGYAIANTPSMDYLWMPFLVAWLVKLLVLRYAGLKTYRRLVPVSLGLILGDLSVPALWGLYGTIVSKRMYLFFPH